MKTLHLGMGWFPEQAGGLNRVYYDCIHSLPQVGVEVGGLVAGSNQIEKASNGRVRAFAPIASPLFQRWCRVRRAFNQLLTQEEYPLIVSHFALYTFPLLDRIGHRSLVAHFQGPWAAEGRIEGNHPLTVGMKRAIEAGVYRRVSRFIVLSQAFRDILHRQYDVPLERIEIVPPGLDPGRFEVSLTPSEARSRLGWPQGRPIVFAVRRLAQRMGLENLIAAISQVRQHYPEIFLAIAGRGELKAALQKQIETLELNHNVRLLGFISETDLTLAYKAADFSIVPTVALEGFGLIVIESLASGTPVLGTPVDSLPEILQPFCHDLVLEGTSPEHLAQGIIETLAGKRQLPTPLACQTYVRNHYAPEAIARRIKAVYQATLEGKPQ